MTDNKELVFVAQYPPSGDLERWLYDQMVLIQQSIDTLRTSQGSWNNPKWDDEKFPSVQLQNKKNTTSPSITYALNTQTYVFDDTYSSTDSLLFIEQLPHAWDEETTLGPHLHTININAIAGDVRWALTYRKINNFQVAVTSTTVYATQTLSGTANKSEIIGFPALETVGLRISDFIVGEVWRNSGDAADTATGGICLLEFDIHVKKNTDGSREPYTK